MSFPKGENHHKWKGKNVSYSGLHKWVNKYKGKAFGCTVCGSQKRQRYEWANISGEYKRDLDDFESKCVPCHRENLKGITPKYTFPKGNIPWNKYLQPKICQECGKTFQPKNAKNASKYCSQKCYWETLKISMIGNKRQKGNIIC